MYTGTQQPTRTPRAYKPLVSCSADYLKTSNPNEFGIIEKYTFEQMKGLPFVGSGSYKNVYSWNEDTVVVAPKEANVHEFKEFLTEAAKHVLIHNLWKTQLWDQIDDERKQHYASIPEIVAISWIVSANTSLYVPIIIMEKIPAILSNYMKYNHVNKRRDFCIVLYQITRTVQWLHRQCNFIHGDLKMNNVGLKVMKNGACPRVQACLFDFGLSSIQWGEVSIPSPLHYKNIYTPNKLEGAHGNNDILFFLISSYAVWGNYLGFNRNNIRSILDAYIFYLVDMLYAQINSALPKDKTRHYAAYNPTTAGKLFDGSVQYDVVRLILSSYKTDACVQLLLRATEEADDPDVIASYQKEIVRQLTLLQKLEAKSRSIEQAHIKTIESIETQKASVEEALKTAQETQNAQVSKLQEITTVIDNLVNILKELQVEKMDEAKKDQIFTRSLSIINRIGNEIKGIIPRK